MTMFIPVQSVNYMGRIFVKKINVNSSSVRILVIIVFVETITKV